MLIARHSTISQSAQAIEGAETFSYVSISWLRAGLHGIRDKEFHCLGGSVYAPRTGGQRKDDGLRLIVAFQTISDYLDNLCDRTGVNRSRPSPSHAFYA